MDLSPFLEFARQTAWEAGRLTLATFETAHDTEYKADSSPVTVADRAAEQFIRHRIESAFPGHAILGEEFGDSAEAPSSHRWIIDPIDGTKSFICGVPIYAVLLALEIEGEAVVGVAHFPALDEMISAASGQGCFRNGRACRVSQKAPLSKAILAHADTSSFARQGAARGAAWDRLRAATYYNAGWCDAYGYALVATGRVEIMLDPVMNLWDCAPLLPIVREAGGYFGDWQGNERIDAGEALATNARLRDEVLALLNKAG
ncbi:MAG: inositol monophosphatase family protein [Verrucomicrobia bacterium]|nr:inositol monophosphatase family protein [Verrucomicrobiota bacterium]